MAASDTQRLIEELAAQAAPVRPVASPGRRLMGVLALATVVIAVALAGADGIRPDLAQAARSAVFWVESLALLAVALTAGYAALSLDIPGRAEEGPLKLVPFAPLAVWLTSLLLRDLPHESWALPADGTCTGIMVGVAFIPGLLFLRFARSSAPLLLGWAGFHAALSSAALIGVGLQLVCYDKAPLHFLALHFLPLVAIALLGSAAGRTWLRWWERR